MNISINLSEERTRELLEILMDTEAKTPELLGHEAEEDEVDRAVEQGHDVHHLSQLYKYK